MPTFAAERRSRTAAPPTPPASPEILDAPIVLRGVRVHNLQDLSCEIPAGRLTVVTGVSGSGKSSLVFDTLYAEGQRRYVESLSSYARQFLERMEKPDADSIEGVYPAMAVGQHNPVRGKRATVATSTEIADSLRLLYARLGEPFCPKCGIPVVRHRPQDVAAWALSLPAGTRLFVAWPLELSARMESPSLAKELAKGGWRRLFVNGTLVEVDEAWPAANLGPEDRLLVAVDRLEVSHEEEGRLAEAVETAMREGGGRVVLRETGGAEHPFSEHFACDRCGFAMPEPEPALFSFNHPQGACPDCKGFGNTLALDERKIIPDPSLTLEEGAIEPWSKESRQEEFEEMLEFARRRGIPLDTPYDKLDKAQREALWTGEGKRHGFPGIEGFFRRLERKNYRLHVRVYLSRYRRYADCLACGGTRLRPEAHWFRLGGRTLPEVMRMTLAEALTFCEGLPFGPSQAPVAKAVFEELLSRLRYLQRVGLGYLTLDRLTSTLSGGEAQRIALATILGAALTGTMLILDEPTVGLHARDTERLLGVLRSLRDLGNTVIMVEHDRAAVEAADYVLELGPGAGSLGGRLMASAPLKEFLKTDTLTASYLRGERGIPRGEPSKFLHPKRALVLRGIERHNLHGLDARIPLGGLVALTGVSGSGKSTLMRDVLYAEFTHHRATRGKQPPLFCRRIDGFGFLEDMIFVDQSPLGRSSRSNALTLTGALAPLRRLFAATEDARMRGFGPGHFSFNSASGRCPACEGAGWTEVDMQFLANVRLVCEACGGRRFRPEVLEVRFRGYHMHEIMEMTVEQSMALFADHPEMVEMLRPLREVGLGYLRLGQPTSTLSGGEAQRMKLAAELGSRRRHALYLFDEPSTGLHLHDVEKLLDTFRRLIAQGNSVLVIEHHLDIVAAADWVMDLGPEAAEEGGRIVAEGPPGEIARCAASHTGLYLKSSGL